MRDQRGAGRARGERVRLCNGAACVLLVCNLEKHDKLFGVFQLIFSCSGSRFNAILINIQLMTLPD